MLFFATSINYVGRQVLGLLAPTLQHSIGWTEAEYGYIVGAFQFAYGIGLVAAGRMVDRLGCRIGFALIMGFWRLASMGHALAASALGFGIARFFLGLGEAGSFPAAIKTTAEWFPQRERSLATGIFNSGANIGAILAPALIPSITLRFGWRAAFPATGILGAIWIVWWLIGLFDLVCGGNSEPRHGGPSRMVRESVHDSFGYVSAKFCRCCGRGWWNGRLDGCCLILIDFRVGAAVLSQLHSLVLDCGRFLSSWPSFSPYNRTGFATSGRRRERGS